MPENTGSRVRIDWARLFAENPDAVKAADDAVNHCIANGSMLSADTHWLTFIVTSDDMNVGSGNMTSYETGIDLDKYVMLETAVEEPGEQGDGDPSAVAAVAEAEAVVAAGSAMEPTKRETPVDDVIGNARLASPTK